MTVLLPGAAADDVVAVELVAGAVVDDQEAEGGSGPLHGGPVAWSSLIPHTMQRVASGWLKCPSSHSTPLTVSAPAGLGPEADGPCGTGPVGTAPTPATSAASASTAGDPEGGIGGAVRPATDPGRRGGPGGIGGRRDVIGSGARGSSIGASRSNTSNPADCEPFTGCCPTPVAVTGAVGGLGRLLGRARAAGPVGDLDPSAGGRWELGHQDQPGPDHHAPFERQGPVDSRRRADRDPVGDRSPPIDRSDRSDRCLHGCGQIGHPHPPAVDHGVAASRPLDRQPAVGGGHGDKAAALGVPVEHRGLGHEARPVDPVDRPTQPVEQRTGADGHEEGIRPVADEPVTGNHDRPPAAQRFGRRATLGRATVGRGHRVLPAATARASTSSARAAAVG